MITSFIKSFRPMRFAGIHQPPCTIRPNRRGFHVYACFHISTPRRMCVDMFKLKFHPSFRYWILRVIACYDISNCPTRSSTRKTPFKFACDCVFVCILCACMCLCVRVCVFGHVLVGACMCACMCAYGCRHSSIE